jgi:hypothetical protein
MNFTHRRPGVPLDVLGEFVGRLAVPAARCRRMIVRMTEKTWTAADLRAELARYHAELLAAGNHRPSTVATYVQHPERFIAYLEGTYDPRLPQRRNAR